MKEILRNIRDWARRLSRPIIASVATCLAMTAVADPPTYINKTASGTTSAEVIFGHDPLLQPRIVLASATSDKSGSVLSFRSGTTAYTVTAATVNATNIALNTTNGVGATTNVILYHAGTWTSATTHSVLSGNTTNIWITATNSIVPAVGDEVFLLGPKTDIKVGAATLNIGSEAVFVGNRGRPIRCILDGTSACSVDSMTARYE